MNKIIKTPVILILLSLFFIINTSKLFAGITFNGAFKRNQMGMIEKGTNAQLCVCSHVAQNKKSEGITVDIRNICVMTKGLINCTTEAVDSDGDMYVSKATGKIKGKIKYMTIILDNGKYIDRKGNKGEYTLGVFDRENVMEIFQIGGTEI